MKNKMYLNVAITFLFACLMASTSFAQLTSNDGNIHLQNQTLFGDNASALYWNSNHSTVSQIILRDKEQNIRYGRLLGTGNGVYFGLTDGDNNWTYYTKKDEFSAFRINNSEKMRILVNGNVGIGTNAPTTKLHIKGNIRSTNWNNLDHYIEMSHGGANSYINHVGNGNMDFRFAGATQMSLTATGVGIGTSTPDNRLDVKGTIRAEEVKVELGWSDYVFYDDYQLPTLEEEEDHIEENGHLIGFESEKAMAGEIQLGDVAKRQQAKIEEIVLHLIELKKENDELKKEMETLKKENDELEKEMEILETKVEE